MAYVHPDLIKLLRIYIDGIPLPVATKMLPRRAHLTPGLLIHLLLHSRAQRQSAGTQKKSEAKISQRNLEALIDSLMRTVKALRWRPSGTEWGEYYDFTNYTDAAFAHKKRLIDEFIASLNPQSIWDLGGNTGEFSRASSDRGIQTVCFDIDPVAVEKNYRLTKKQHEEHMLPLLLDLTNPSPLLGWANQERSSLSARGPVDVVMALALIHHLAISANLPLDSVASYFATLGQYLIIEFIPKTDSKVQILLSTRKDIFPDYSEQGFERAFKEYYDIVQKKSITGSQRTIFLMKKKGT